MSRLLPCLSAQVTSFRPDEAVEGVREEVFSRLGEFPWMRLMVFPEFHTCQASGGPAERHRQYQEMAEPLNGPRVQGLRDIAREAGIWLVPGTLVERGENGELFNTAIAISPAGEVVASYRKIFPWRPFEPFDMGTEFVTFEIPEIGTVGLCICYDLWYPEVIRQLVWMGAELIIVPTQTSTSDREQELILARAAAIHNQVWVMSVNAAGPAGTGRSLLVSPHGDVRFQAPSEAPGDFSSVIDFDAVSAVREFGTVALNRLWSQFKPGDPEVPLPAYGGAINPATWDPTHRCDQGELP